MKIKQPPAEHTVLSNKTRQKHKTTKNIKNVELTASEPSLPLMLKTIANSCVAPDVSLRLYIFSDHKAWLGILICSKDMHRIKEEQI